MDIQSKVEYYIERGNCDELLEYLQTLLQDDDKLKEVLNLIFCNGYEIIKWCHYEVIELMVHNNIKYNFKNIHCHDDKSRTIYYYCYMYLTTYFKFNLC
jgi:hypothetical protein